MKDKLLKASKIIKKTYNVVVKRHHFLIPPKLIKKYLKNLKDRYFGMKKFYNIYNQSGYLKWIEKYEHQTEYIKLKYNPLISILIPVYNVPKKYLSECIESVLNQSYSNFEICIVDDCSTNLETIDTLKEYSKKDKRIKTIYRKTNGHISSATNDALKIAKGDFIALLDNDDLLTKDALYEAVKVLNEDNKTDMIYSDEDKIDLDGIRCEPHFKPDFSPDTLLSLNYICHLTILRKKIVDEIGGFTIGLEGAQDYDLFLRFTEKTNNIYHINKILYHWRMIPTSTSMSTDNKNYAVEKGRQALENALKRRKIKGEVKIHNEVPYYYIDYKYNKEPKVAIIIPTKDHFDFLSKCLESLFMLTSYENYEVIIMDNGSTEKLTLDLLKKYTKKHKNFKVIDADFEFNYSKLNNIGVNNTDAEYIMLLNNDTEILDPNWLGKMVGYAMQKHIGAVGPKLLYEDTTVQHAGVVLGLRGVASHAYSGSNRNDCGHYGRLAVPYDYSAVTAACLLISKKKYLEVGGLDETIKVAFNDVDFNLKLLKKDYYNVFLPQVELMHYESKSRGFDDTTEKYQRLMKENNLILSRWQNEINNDIFYNSNFSKDYWFVLNK
ncbi:MAG: glycosyltransferase [Bacilli bacterium]|nr:glycosyltransferase [Bacilli bacterium]